MPYTDSTALMTGDISSQWLGAEILYRPQGEALFSHRCVYGSTGDFVTCPSYGTRFGIRRHKDQIDVNFEIQHIFGDDATAATILIDTVLYLRLDTVQSTDL